MTSSACPSCNALLGAQEAYCPRCGIAAASTSTRKRKVLWLWILIGAVIACPVAVVGVGLLASVLMVQQESERLARESREMKLPPADENGAEDEIDRIVTALLEYAIRNQGRYPESFVELVTPDAEGASYIENPDVLLDPWEREYVYEPPASAESLPRVWSLGPDGLPHTADDVQGTVMQADPPEEHR
jgi:hypothetical protein